MGDLGWVLLEDERAWVLHDQQGDRVHGSVVPTRLLATPRLLASLNRFGAHKSRRWPELNPEAGSWWQCVLAGGALDGAREWLDPDVYRTGPPPGLVFAWDDMDTAGQGPVTLTSVLTYRRGDRCAHGDGCRGCPVPYTLAGEGRP